MKPAPFEYHDPSTVDEALHLLRRYGGEARLLAGGQSLVPLLNFRLATPAALIDLNHIDALSYIQEQDGQVRIGAMTRQRTIEFSGLIRARVPLLAEATKMVGHLPTRTRGTIGGSLAHADPAAEYPCVARVLDAELVIRSADGERVVHSAEYFQGMMATAIGAGEILTEIRVPAGTAANSGYAFEEFGQRHGDFALAGVAAIVIADGTGGIKARLAACSVGDTPIRLRNTEKILEEGDLGEQSIDAACECAAAEVDPTADIHASADYRRHLVRVLTGRALRHAVVRCREAAE